LPNSNARQFLMQFACWTETALSAGEMPSGIADKLRLVADLANSLRQQLHAPVRAARQASAPVP